MTSILCLYYSVRATSAHSSSFFSRQIEYAITQHEDFSLK